MTDTLTTDNTVASEPDFPMLVSLLRKEWSNFVDVITTSDEKLNTDGGAAALGRAAIEKLEPGVADNVSTTATNLLNGLTAEEKLAVVTLIRKALRTVDADVKAYVEANKTEAAELSDAETTSIREARKEAVGSANALRVAVKTSAPSWALVDGNLDNYFPEYTNLRGSSGPRKSAERLRGSFAWAIDGNPIDSDKIADVAKKIGVGPTDLKIALKEYMTEMGREFDFASPPEQFEFLFTSGNKEDPDGHVDYRITAVKRDSDTDEADGAEADDEVYSEPTDNADLFADDDD